MLETNSEMSPQFMQLAVVLPDHTLVREERCAVGVAVVRATNAQKRAIVRGRVAAAASKVNQSGIAVMSTEPVPTVVAVATVAETAEEVAAGVQNPTLLLVLAFKPMVFGGNTTAIIPSVSPVSTAG